VKWQNKVVNGGRKGFCGEASNAVKVAENAVIQDSSNEGTQILLVGLYFEQSREPRIL